MTRESRFVRRVMPNASEAEIAEATRRWFGFLETIDRIGNRLEREAKDSAESGNDDRFQSDAPHV